MNQADGFVKLWRRIRDWELYDNILCRLLLIELLIDVNHEGMMFRGIEVKPGETITTYRSLAKSVKSEHHKVSRALSKMEEIGTIKIIKHPRAKYSHISVNNWLKYQDNSEFCGQKADKKRTDKRRKEESTSTNVDATQKEIEAKRKRLRGL